MSRTEQYQSIILKKQAYGEGDEIITVYTREAGKLRVMGKSTKISTSKLQYSLQALFLVKITVVGKGSLPRIIGAEIVDTFSRIRESWGVITKAQYVTELLIKFTPDEEKHEQLFDLIISFLSFLNMQGLADENLEAGLGKFKILLLQTLGFGIAVESGILAGENNQAGFSNSKGSFTLSDTVDKIPTSKQTLEQFQRLQKLSFADIAHNVQPENLQNLQDVLSGFLTYQLERDIRSERFMEM